MAVEGVETGNETVKSENRSVEVELRVRDRNCFFVAASARGSCRFELVDMVRRSDGRILEFFAVRGASPERVGEIVADSGAIDEARLVRESDDGSLFEFVLTGPCVMVTLADNGVFASSVVASNGTGRVVAEVPPHIDVRSVVERFQEHHPDSEMIARRHRDGHGHVYRNAGTDPLAGLTHRQIEVLRTAYRSGYFEWPRDTPAEGCAATLGITQPTFSQHVRTGQRRLFEVMFDSRSTAETAKRANANR